jgi:hypothetical protein
MPTCRRYHLAVGFTKYLVYLERSAVGIAEDPRIQELALKGRLVLVVWDGLQSPLVYERKVTQVRHRQYKQTVQAGLPCAETQFLGHRASGLHVWACAACALAHQRLDFIRRFR